MRAAWSAMPAQREMLLQRGVSELEDVAIVEEYNGPQIVFATLDEQRLFGVASDEDERVERWVFAPVSRTEEAALRAGVASLREALRKSGARIIDFARGGSGFHVTPIAGDQLTEDELPAADARLSAEQPLDILEEDELRFTLDGLNGLGAGLSFDATADVLRGVQRYANATGAFLTSHAPQMHGRFPDEILNKARLSFQSALPGSLVLNVLPNDRELWGQIFTQLSDTVAAEDDRDRLAILNKQSGPRALLRYQDLLVTLERHQLQLLAQKGHTATFLSFSSAGRFSRALPDAVQRKVEPIVCRGYFSAYNRDKPEFTLVDSEKDIAYTGTIHPDELSKNKPVTVGEDVFYVVELAQQAVTKLGGTTQHRYELSRIIE